MGGVRAGLFGAALAGRCVEGTTSIATPASAATVRCTRRRWTWIGDIFLLSRETDRRDALGADPSLFLGVDSR
jgi:hypothetical protein